jgi:hypothetical protein
MTANYKVIFRSDLETPDNDVLTWEPGCPIMVEALQVSRNTETSETYLQSKVRNVRKKTVEGIDLLVTVVSCDGKSETHTLSLLDVDIKPNGIRALKVVPLETREVSTVTMDIKRVRFANGSLWESARPVISMGKPIPLALSEEAMKERTEELNEASYRGSAPYQNEHHSDYWRCSCGQVNPPNQEVCLNCGTQAEDLGWEYHDPAPYQNEHHSDYWRCSCGQVNVLTQSTCRRCGIEEKDWTMLNDEEYLLEESRKRAEDLLEESRENARKRRIAKWVALVGSIVILTLVSILVLINLLNPPTNMEIYENIPSLGKVYSFPSMTDSRVDAAMASINDYAERNRVPVKVEYSEEGSFWNIQFDAITPRSNWSQHQIEEYLSLCGITNAKFNEPKSSYPIQSSDDLVEGTYEFTYGKTLTQVAWMFGATQSGKVFIVIADAAPDKSNVTSTSPSSTESQNTLSTTSSEGTLSESEVYGLLVEYYDALGRIDRGIAEWATEFNTSYSASRSTRQTVYDRYYGTASVVLTSLNNVARDYVSYFGNGPYSPALLPEKYRPIKEKLDSCYTLLYQRADVIARASERSLEFENTSGNESYINEPLQEALDSNNQNVYLQQFNKLYAEANPSSVK